MHSGHDGIGGNRRIRITCLVARWVTDTSADLCGVSRHWVFECLLPSKLSTPPSVSRSRTQGLSTTSDLLGLSSCFQFFLFEFTTVGPCV